jgi:hypothetical protein
MAYRVRGQRLANPNKQEMDQVSPAIDHSDIRNVCAPLRFEEKVKSRESQTDHSEGTSIRPQPVRQGLPEPFVESTLY